jgi:hypothetical protein
MNTQARNQVLTTASLWAFLKERQVALETDQTDPRTTYTSHQGPRVDQHHDRTPVTRRSSGARARKRWPKTWLHMNEKTVNDRLTKPGP